MEKKLETIKIMYYYRKVFRRIYIPFATYYIETLRFILYLFHKTFQNYTSFIVKW